MQRLFHAKGKKFQLRESASPIQDEYGTTVGVVLVFKDVSERKRVQEALKTSQIMHKVLWKVP